MDAKRRQLDAMRSARGSLAGRARQAALGFAVALPFLAAPAVLTAWIGHSTYLFGMAAVLLCATRLDWVAVAAAALATLLFGVAIDRAVGIELHEATLRAVIYLGIAGTLGWWARAYHAAKQSDRDALADLAHKEAVLRSILDNGPDAMLVIDCNGVVSSFNPAAEALFGWRQDEVIGRNINMLMPEPYHSEHDSYIAAYVRTGERKIIGKRREVTGLRKDGSHFPMVLHVGEAQIGDERYFTGFVHDLTSLNEAHDRTNELRSQLSYVWRMNSLGEMAAVLAHELNQPLAAISNYVRGARTFLSRMELADADDVLDALEETSKQALRAGEIIRRTRAMLARNDAEKEPVSLAALMSEIDLMLGLVAREAAVQIRYAMAPGPDVAIVDRIQIQQVVGNLVRNAVDAMRNCPQRTLEITTEKQSQFWVVRVEDSGPGIDPDMADQLFTPLVSTKPQGMGLGLSISRTIVQNHGGDLWVERSRLGGAAFCFSLPTGDKPQVPVGAILDGSDSLRS